MVSRALRQFLVGLVSLVWSVWASAAILQSNDGLSLALLDSNGAVREVLVDGEPVPLIPGQPGGVTLEVGTPVEPFTLLSWSFEADGGDWTAARNSDWEGAGPYVTWLLSGGIEDTAHLLLGDGATEGAGMAMGSMIPVTEGRVVRVSWQAKSASTATTQILNVRVYDALGQDITDSANTPTGWSWTSTSQAHAVWGISPDESDTWQAFDFDYAVATGASFIRVSLRHWTGGDHWLHVDDFQLEVVGGIEWGAVCRLSEPIVLGAGAIQQTGQACALGIQVTHTITPQPGYFDIALTIEDTGGAATDIPVRLVWTLPVDLSGGQWWDDIEDSRTIAPGEVYSHAFPFAEHELSLYPYCSVTGAGSGLALAVPMNEATVQRFEYDPAAGLRSIWEIGLSQVTSLIGPGRASVTLKFYAHDPSWGFRSATQRYHEIFPEHFVKRTRREGAWMYPIHASQIPDPLDFGFAFLETWPFDQAERLVCQQHDIGVFYYVEPWLAWKLWSFDPQKPPYQERVDTLNAWAQSQPSLATCQPDGGIADSGHLLLGDGIATGAGMATSNAFQVIAGQSTRIRWQARVADIATTQILGVRVYDQQGTDITSSVPSPTGWFYSPASQAHVIAGIANSTTNAWQIFERDYAMTPIANSMRLSLRYWNGGDLYVHVDDLEVLHLSGGITFWSQDFDSNGGAWTSAHNADWDDGGPTWLRVPQQQAAQAVVGASPLDDEGQYFIDGSSYLWHEWSPGAWNQAWPINPDPDLPSPSMYDVYMNEWILPELDQNDGIYIDSVSLGGGISFWRNRRQDHLALTDTPLTFSLTDGRAEQLPHQCLAKFLTSVAQEVRGRGKLMMLNLFPTPTRFAAHHADIMGSEVSRFVEPDVNSRLRRTLAAKRIVSNLLQWNWFNQPTYATHEQIEEFILGQLFWGFYPAISSAGGLPNGGTPDRYFLHPELYERDRVLFQRYIPVIRDLSSSGWEPVTYARLDAAGQVERYGDFERSPVYLTVRGLDQSGFAGEVTVDLRGSGLTSGFWFVQVADVLNAQSPAATVLTDPARLRFGVVLAPGEVGVYRLGRLELAPADFDQDGDVDGEDYALLATCLTGPPGPTGTGSCSPTNMDADAATDLFDFALFQMCFSGSGVTADPDCAD